MLIAMLAVLVGFGLLIWSADRFVDGAAATAYHAGMPSLLIGMVIVGFGTSAPEMVVSPMAALDGSPELALGNALGSNIVNTGLILGVTALIMPIMVHSKIVRRELPLLILICLGAGLMLWDNAVLRWEAALLLLGFFALIGWSVFSAIRDRGDALATDFDQEIREHTMPLAKAIIWLAVGLIVLVASSRLLVWGAVTIAESLGVSDLIIGLTIVALGTSLPELASSVIAVRKGEHDIAIGNIVGSNMFNILAVVGIAGLIEPLTNLSQQVLTRDWGTMMLLMVMLLFMAYGFRGQGRINRLEGFGLLLVFITYNSYLAFSVLTGSA